MGSTDPAQNNQSCIECLVKALGWIFRRRKPEAYADHAEHLKSWDPSSPLLRDLGVVMSASNGSESLRILGVKRN